MQDSVRKYFTIWAATALAALCLLDPNNWLGYFPSMIVHELGHTLFSFLSNTPAVAFLFATFTLAEAPVTALGAILVLLELYAAYCSLRTNHPLFASLAAVALATNIFFLLFPKLAAPFIIFGGVGGEFLIPVIFLVAVIELSPYRKELCAFFAVASFVFWRSLIGWLLAWSGTRAIPYPRDSSGGVSLFADPFEIAEGAPVGDMDKLITIHGWSESAIVESYALLGIASLCVSCMLWWYAFHKKSTQTE